MKNIFVKDSENTVNYLTPATVKRLLITMGIKLVLTIAGVFAMPAEGYAGLTKVLLLLLFFAFIYDICSLYQLCLHVTQSILIGFLLFLLAIFGVGAALQYGSKLFIGIAPASTVSENIITIVMLLIFLIPFLIDAIRLIKLLTSSSSTHT